MHEMALTAYQDWLWNDVFMPGVDAVSRMANRAQQIVVIQLGDICHGDAHPDQLVSTRLSDQIMIARASMRPLLELPRVTTLRIVIGTGAHEFGEGSAAILVAEQIRADLGLDVQALYHGLATIGGFDVDYSHHGPGPGGRSWLGGNVARYYLRDQMFKAIAAGQKPAGLYLRGHVHVPVDEMVRVGPHWGRIVVAPSMCGLGDYGRKTTKSEWEIVNGFMAFAIEGGRIVDTMELVQKVVIRTKEML